MTIPVFGGAQITASNSAGRPQAGLAIYAGLQELKGFEFLRIAISFMFGFLLFLLPGCNGREGAQLAVVIGKDENADIFIFNPLRGQFQTNYQSAR